MDTQGPILQLPIDDTNIIRTQHQQRLRNRPYSERSKCPKETRVHTPFHKIAVGDLVYLRTERDKTKARNRYLVVLIDHPWCFIKKFTNTVRFEQSPIKSALTNAIVFPVK